MAVQFLDKQQSKIIKELNYLFQKKYPDWLCEGSEDKDGTPCNAIFNNNTDTFFLSDYDGKILEWNAVAFGQLLGETDYQKARLMYEDMAKIQGLIRKVADNNLTKEDKSALLGYRIEGGVYSLEDNISYKNYLEMNKNFANYSVNNKLLVFMQRPDATMVKGANTWFKEYERHIIKGEKAINILAPSIYKKEIDASELDSYKGRGYSLKEDNGDTCIVEKIFYKSVSVFDVSQTAGKELPPHDFCPVLNDETMTENQYEVLMQTISDVAKAQNPDISIRLEEKNTDSILKGGAHGYFRPSTNEIVVDKDMPMTQQVKTLVHEIAHSLLHGEEMKVEGLEDTSKILNRSDKECQAESVAFMVCDSLGIDTSSYSFPYVASWVNEDADKFKSNLDIIDKTAKQLIKGLEKTNVKETIENSFKTSDFEEEEEEEYEIC